MPGWIYSDQICVLCLLSLSLCSTIICDVWEGEGMLRHLYFPIFFLTLTFLYFFFVCLFFGFYKETQENSGFIIFLCDKCTCLFHCLKVRTNLLFRFFSSIFPPFQFTFVSFVQFTVVSSRQSIFN